MARLICSIALAVIGWLVLIAASAVPAIQGIQISLIGIAGIVTAILVRIGGS